MTPNLPVLNMYNG